jgi:hypothetical protein
MIQLLLLQEEEDRYVLFLRNKLILQAPTTSPLSTENILS